LPAAVGGPSSAPNPNQGGAGGGGGAQAQKSPEGSWVCSATTRTTLAGAAAGATFAEIRGRAHGAAVVAIVRSTGGFAKEYFSWSPGRALLIVGLFGGVTAGPRGFATEIINFLANYFAGGNRWGELGAGLAVGAAT